MKMLKILQENQNLITAENRESFELLNQILDFAQIDLMDELSKVEFGSEDDPRLLYVSFLARAIKNGISILTISSEGLNEDTSILLRALIEQVCYTYFIATLEDKSKILEQFTHHEYCRVKRYRKQIKEVSPGHQFPDDDDVEKKCQEYKNKFHKNDIYWTGRNTSYILKEVITKFPNKDFGRLYLKWSLLSNFVHSSQMAFESIVQPEFTISLAPDPSQLCEDLIWTDICLLRILELINSEFELAFESILQKFLDKILEEMKKDNEKAYRIFGKYFGR